jgi:uncharacterized small protein (DUF1192 family)
MTSLRDLLRLLRLAQAQMSVAYYQRDIERSKCGLAKAFAARDAALAAVRIHEVPQRDSEPPRYLLKQPAPLRAITKRKA